MVSHVDVCGMKLVQVPCGLFLTQTLQHMKSFKTVRLLYPEENHDLEIKTEAQWATAGYRTLLVETVANEYTV